MILILVQSKEPILVIVHSGGGGDRCAICGWMQNKLLNSPIVPAIVFTK